MKIQTQFGVVDLGNPEGIPEHLDEVATDICFGLILRREKTTQQIPAKYREKVTERLRAAGMEG